MSRPPLLQALIGGDRRSIGEAAPFVEPVLAAPERFSEIVAGLDDPDPVVRIRAADVAEKVSRARPDWLGPHKAVLLGLMSTARDKEVRWHLAQTAPRLPLEAGERRVCFALLFAWIDDPSRIVAAAALSALAELADAKRACGEKS